MVVYDDGSVWWGLWSGIIIHVAKLYKKISLFRNYELLISLSYTV